jgi:hypothetical protein
MSQRVLRTRTIAGGSLRVGVPERRVRATPGDVERIGPDGDGGDWDDDENGISGSTGGAIWGGIVLGVVGTITVVGGVLTSWLRQATRIRWADVAGQIPGGEDTVTLSDNGPGTEGMYTVTLTVPAAITWWKAAELYDRNGFMRGTAFTQDDKKSSTMIVPASEVDGGFLVLKKAKFFGIHSAMYVIHDVPYEPGEVPELRTRVGRNLTLNWAAD